MQNTINLNELIQNEVNRISLKYGKDFLDCEDLINVWVLLVVIKSNFYLTNLQSTKLDFALPIKTL